MADTLSIRLPGAQMLTTRILCMKCIGFEESVWKGLSEENMLKISMCQLMWMIALLLVNKKIKNHRFCCFWKKCPQDATRKKAGLNPEYPVTE